MKIRCYTNLDAFQRCRWPDDLPAVPSRGDRVQAEDGKELRVVGLTWAFDGTLIIELHRGGTL